MGDRRVSRAAPILIEPRAWKRVTPRHPVLVSATDGAEHVARGGALDISAGGLGCYLYGPPLAPGSDVLTRLNLHGQGHRVLKVPARIAWVRPFEDQNVTRYGLTWREGGDLEEVRAAVSALG